MTEKDLKQLVRSLKINSIKLAIVTEDRIFERVFLPIVKYANMKIKRQKPRREEQPRMSASGGFAEEKAQILYPRFNQINL